MPALQSSLPQEANPFLSSFGGFMKYSPEGNSEDSDLKSSLFRDTASQEPTNPTTVIGGSVPKRGRPPKSSQYIDGLPKLPDNESLVVIDDLPKNKSTLSRVTTKRQLKNRDAAARCRQKKLDCISTLTFEKQTLLDEAASLRQELAQVEMELFGLTFAVQEHLKAGCNVETKD